MTDNVDKSENLAVSLGVLVNMALSILSLVRAVEAPKTCRELKAFAVTFSVVNIAYSTVKGLVLAASLMKTPWATSKAVRFLFAGLGMSLIGLAAWGSALTFSAGSDEAATVTHCSSLYDSSKTMCIVTWVVVGIMLHKKYRMWKRGRNVEQPSKVDDEALSRPVKSTANDSHIEKPETVKNFPSA